MLRGAGDNFFRQHMSNTIFHREDRAKRRPLNRPQPAVYYLLHSLGQQCRDMVERVALLRATATLKPAQQQPDQKRCVGYDATTPSEMALSGHE